MNHDAVSHPTSLLAMTVRHQKPVKQSTFVLARRFDCRPRLAYYVASDGVSQSAVSITVARVSTETTGLRRLPVVGEVNGRRRPFGHTYLFWPSSNLLQNPSRAWSHDFEKNPTPRHHARRVQAHGRGWRSSQPCIQRGPTPRLRRLCIFPQPHILSNRLASSSQPRAALLFNHLTSPSAPLARNP